jgi:hypothetical protein
MVGREKRRYIQEKAREIFREGSLKIITVPFYYYYYYYYYYYS